MLMISVDSAASWRLVDASSVPMRKSQFSDCLRTLSRRKGACSDARLEQVLVLQACIKLSSSLSMRCVSREGQMLFWVLIEMSRPSQPDVLSALDAVVLSLLGNGCCVKGKLRNPCI